MTSDIGGYELDFVDQPPEDFCCGLCKKVLRETHLTTCCSRYYCNSCLQHWENTGNTSCPNCNGNLNHTEDKRQQRQISGLYVNCKKRRLGCNWMGEIGNLYKHLESCDYIPVSCPNRCKEKVLRTDLPFHIARECSLRQIVCPYCHKFQGTSPEVKNHEETCPDVPVVCPNSCNSERMRCIDIVKHRTVCPNEPVECPFKGMGCMTPVLRREVDEHMERSTQMHTMLLMSTLDTMKAKTEKVLQAHRQEIQVNKRELNVTKDKLESELQHLQDENTLLRKKLNGLSHVVSEMQDTSGDPKLKSQLESIHVLLDMEEHHIKRDSPVITLQMANFSTYKKSWKSNTWQSPPFYVADGYKMCVIVHANGLGKGKGSHVSVFLNLMKGEFDEGLSWPCDLGKFGLELKALRQKESVSGQRPPLQPMSFIPIDSDVPTDRRQRVQTNILQQLGGREQFVDNQTFQDWILLDDTVVFQVTFM